MNKESILIALNEIVFQNLQLDNILTELASCSNTDVSYLCPNVSSLVKILEDLLDCINARKPVDLVYLRDDEQSKQVELILENVNMASDSSREEFALAICSLFQKEMPLEVYCLLHKHSVILIENYFQRTLSVKVAQNRLSEAIVTLFLSPNPMKNSSKWMASIVSHLFVECIFESGVKTSVKKACCAILDAVIQNVILTSVNDASVQLGDRLDLIQATMEIPGLPLSKLKSLANCVFVAILNYDQANGSIDKAITDQKLWLCKSNSPFFVGVLSRIAVILEPKEMVEIIKNRLRNNYTSWRSLLVVTSVIVTRRSEGIHLIYGLIEKLVKESLTTFEMDQLKSGFVLARQLSLEKPPSSLTYEQWFHKSFGDGSTTLANGPKAFQFLMECLTKCVPYDQAIFLKAHIMKPPHPATKCRNFLNEYLVLAKTRLHDLKESIEDLGIFAGNLAGKLESQAKLDVKIALESYESTNKIPNGVMEASFLRKAYFTDRFLKILLEPRMLPDVPDVKIKFIEDLKKAGKIPPVLYENYLKKCRNETSKLFEGLEEDIEMDLFEEVTCSLDPLNDLKESLENLNKSFSSFSEDITALITNVSAKIANYVQSLPKSLVATKNCYNYAELASDYPQTTEVMEKIVASFCVTAAFYKANPSFLSKDAMGASWNHLFVSMLSWFKVLELPLFSYMWSICVVNDKLSSQSEEFNCGVVLLLRRIGQLYDATVSEIDDQVNKSTLPNAIFNQLKISTWSERELFLKFALEYLKICSDEKQLDCAVEETVLKKFHFVSLCQRPSSKRGFDSKHEHDDTVTDFYKITDFQSSIKTVKLSFSDCVNFESQIEMENLSPEERLDRLRFWCFYCNVDPQEGMTDVVNVLLAKKNASYFLLINILQELSYRLEPMTDDMSWLQKLFFNLFDSAAQVDVPISVDYHLKGFFSIACGMPPHLLLTNQPNEIVPQTSLEKVCQMVNRWLKPYLCERGFLTKQFTIYFYHAIVQSQNSDTVFKYFNQHCPLILASLVYHWPISTTGFSGNKPYIKSLLNDLETIHKDVQNVPSYTYLPAEFVGLILYTKGLKVLANASENQTLPADVIQSAVQFAVLNHTCELKTFQPSIRWSVENLKLIVSPALKHCKQLIPTDSVIGKMFSETTVSLYPLACITLWLEVFETEVAENLPVNARVQALQIMLQNLTHCNQLHDNSGYSPIIGHVISLISLTSRIQQILQTVPALLLKALPKDVLHSCDTPLQIIINNRIRNG